MPPYAAPAPLKAFPPRDIGGGNEPPSDGPPKMDTKSSRGLLDVPASRFAAAGVFARTSVAAKPDGWPSNPVESSKSL